jgi:hypothetical protein
MYSYTSGIVNAAIRNYNCVFGRNLYDTDEINSILEIRLTLYCPDFEEFKPSFLNVTDFFKSSHFDVSFCIFCCADTRTKIL